MGRAYRVVNPGAIVTPALDGYKMACCDCGLVHVMRFRVLKVTKHRKDGSWEAKKMPRRTYRIAMQAWRDEAATVAMRRERAKRSRSSTKRARP